MNFMANFSMQCIEEENENSEIQEVMHAKGRFIVLNEKGLHTRPSTELVKCAANFRSKIFLIHRDMTVNAKSLLGILMLAAARGSKITVEAEGEDAKEAIDTLMKLAQNKFYIKY